MREPTIKLSDSDDESTRERAKLSSSTCTKPKSTAHVKRGVVISDDDDKSKLPVPPMRPKAMYKEKVKAATPDTNAEKELQVMMDINDSK